MATADPDFATLDDPGDFPTAIDALVDGCDDGETPRSLVELRICEVAGAIRDREIWWEKVNSDNIVEHWRQEVCTAENDEKAIFHYALALTNLKRVYKNEKPFQLGLDAPL